MRTVVSCLTVISAACSNPIIASDFVATGTSGGDHVAVEVTAEGGRIEHDCAHGEVGESLRVDRDDRFDMIGPHAPEHGGPIREDE